MGANPVRSRTGDESRPTFGAKAQDLHPSRLQCLGTLRFLGPQRPDVKKAFPASRAAIRGNLQEPPREVSPGGGNFPPRNPIQLRGVASRTARPPGPPGPATPPGMKAVIAFVAAVRILARERPEVVAQSPAARAIDALLAAFGADMPMRFITAGLFPSLHQRNLSVRRAIQYCTPSGIQMMSNVRLREPPRRPPRPSTVARRDWDMPRSRK